MESVKRIFEVFFTNPFESSEKRFDSFIKGLLSKVSKREETLIWVRDATISTLKRHDLQKLTDLANEKYYNQKQSRGQDQNLWFSSIKSALKESRIFHPQVQYILTRLILAQNRNNINQAREFEEEIMMINKEEEERNLIRRRAEEVSRVTGPHPTDEELDVYEDNHQILPAEVRVYLTSGAYREDVDTGTAA